MIIQQNPISVPATAALGKYLRVKYDSTNGLAAAGANDRELGTLAREHIVSGLGAHLAAPVVTLNTEGTVKMIAAGAIAIDALVYGAASGKVNDVANNNLVGRARSAAAADGDEIEVLRFADGNQLDAVVVMAADATLTAAESGTCYETTGATGAVTVTLPAATPGLEFEFQVAEAQELRLDPDGTETISLPSTGVAGAAGKYLTANAAGESIHIKCFVAGTWAVLGNTGTWTAEA